MLRVVIHYQGDVQVRKLRADTTVERGKEIVEELREEDFIGCDLFQLLQDEVVIYEREGKLCD